MATCFVGLGSNLGNRREQLVSALDAVQQLAGTRVVRKSPFIETAPIGGPAGQEMFLNAVAQIETDQSPQQLLANLQEIESRLGRIRGERWAPRGIDLDLLLFDELRVREPELTIPHPRMHFRRFVLEPLVMIAPLARHPDGWTMAERWERLNRRPHYLAFTGPMGVGKTTVARRVAERLKAELVLEAFDSVRLGRIYEGDHGEADLLQQSFLASRCELLDIDRNTAGKPDWLVSDFWFAQSLAYAELMMSPESGARHRREVARHSRGVIEPSLVIWMDAEPAELVARIQSRGRDFEAPVREDFLACLRKGYERILTGPGAPCTYRPDSTTLEDLTRELVTVAWSIAGKPTP